ncbi:hypothetical protein N7505_007328 [Penicillium chrysogenum]|uniref:Uncharacterized protein n=1 Tax=Penicillium chrysogenum TaxID=5076 RepID=A0ABQ8WDQ5_PENCH|nr:hypothetical protein N7505_007328 [Penicillium chrysogenum]
MGKFNVSNVIVGSDLEKPLYLHGRTFMQGKREFSLSQTTVHDCSIDLHNAGTISPSQFGCYAANNSGGVPGDGMFKAAPRLISASLRSDGVEDDWPFHSASSSWSKPMYSCAMAIEATIMSVTFSYNATDEITGLSVLNITGKVYQSEADHPVWGV